MRRQVAMVAELWRYPLKSMRGERLSGTALTGRIRVGDPVWLLTN